MNYSEIKIKLDTFENKTNQLWRELNTDNKEIKIKELETVMNNTDFWQNKENADQVISELKYLQNSIANIKKLRQDITDNKELLELAELENNEEIITEIANNLEMLEEGLTNLENEVLLSGEFDEKDALISINSGAGGTEACDWAAMLERMYLRWCADKQYKIDIIDEQKGDDAGLKSCSFLVKGRNAYGYLKNEKGVHRLVRISPFDANAKRHTSFAAIDITPILNDEDIDIEININDLRIDVFHSSGAGGQSVNTTDSAVRITHIPTNTVISCQNERSQLQNKEKALAILKNKLYQLELEKRENDLKKIKGESKNIEFGSQIRNYVMHPYSLVKDLRTNTETSQVNKVMDGDIDIFINDLLKWQLNV